MTSITPNVWHPVGLDVTRDGYKGRLGVSYKTGQVVAAGASNGLLSRLPMHYKSLDTAAVQLRPAAVRV